MCPYILPRSLYVSLHVFLLCIWFFFVIVFVFVSRVLCGKTKDVLYMSHHHVLYMSHHHVLYMSHHHNARRKMYSICHIIMISAVQMYSICHIIMYSICHIIIMQDTSDTYTQTFCTLTHTKLSTLNPHLHTKLNIH